MHNIFMTNTKNGLRSKDRLLRVLVVLEDVTMSRNTEAAQAPKNPPPRRDVEAEAGTSEELQPLSAEDEKRDRA